jgi:esterase/lipase superfamily enzyme
LLAAATLAACSGGGPYSIPFMPPPAFLEEAEVTPFTDTEAVAAPADPRVLYATVREPARPGDSERFYSRDRGTQVRLGEARIVLGRSDVTWEMARQMSVLKNGTERYPLQVADIEEYGILDRTIHPILLNSGDVVADPAPRQRFAAAVNQRLATSRKQDVFVYVHGYKVNFENPVLIAAELWHFLGYDGVFIPFAWPSRLGRLDYFGDTESARYSALFLREFLEFLAEETDVRNINILGYSAGTRLVAAALHQLALKHDGSSRDDLARRLRISDVILVGSDIDRGIFATYLADGLANVPARLTIYESPADKALGMALFAFGRERIGQLDPADLSPAARAYLRGSDAISLVSVANAPGFDAGNGHSYFRDSPLVSSDVLAALRYDLHPAERGLEQDTGTGVWEFPADYLNRLEAAIFRADPELARRAGAVAAP